jgi:hypothetical protein
VAKMITAVDLAKGLVSPFPDAAPREVDTYSNSGAFLPQVKVLDVVNALPTEYGYLSFFGEEQQLGSIPGEDWVQEVIVLRTLSGIMLLVALCPGGLWLCCPGSYDTVALASVSPLPTPAVAHLTARKTLTLSNGGFNWVKVAGCTNPSPNPWKWWTYAIVNNRIYFYQQGLAAIVEIADNHKQQVRIDWFKPASIIGTVDCYHEVVTLSYDSQCTTTSQTLTLSARLPTVTLTHLDKAHIAAVADRLWVEKVRTFLDTEIKVR